MPLIIKLAPNEEIVVNGAVIRNGDKRGVITIVNPANILRGKDILFIDDAETAAKKLYFLVQTLLLSAGKELSEISPKVNSLSADLYNIFSSEEAKSDIMHAMNHFSNGDFYKCLTFLKQVIVYEEGVLEKIPASEVVVD